MYASLSGMVSFFSNGAIHGCNHHFMLMLLGYSQEELVGQVRKRGRERERGREGEGGEREGGRERGEREREGRRGRGREGRRGRGREGGRERDGGKKLGRTDTCFLCSW